MKRIPLSSYTKLVEFITEAKRENLSIREFVNMLKNLEMIKEWHKIDNSGKNFIIKFN